eukprot:COSAG02_NODE_107_length_36312_cov_45.037942_9_plen_62_part_00
MERAKKDAEKAEEGEAESAWAAVVSAAEAVLAEIDADRVQVCPQAKPAKFCVIYVTTVASV